MTTFHPIQDIITLPNGIRVVVDKKANLLEGDKAITHQGVIITIQKGWNNSLKLADKILFSLTTPIEGLPVVMVVKDDGFEFILSHYMKLWENNTLYEQGLIKTAFTACYNQLIKAARQGGFSEEQMIGAIKYGFNKGINATQDVIATKEIQDYLQSLTPTPKYLEVDYEKIYNQSSRLKIVENLIEYQPKLTNGRGTGRWVY